MNYLDILPNYLMKIINRKAQDLQVITEEQKEKKIKECRERKKQIADNKKKNIPKNLLIYI